MKSRPKRNAEATRNGGTGFQPVSEALTIRQRNLPHWQMGGATYFLTFRLSREADSCPLTSEERAVVLHAILHWQNVRWHIHLTTIMPDHVHIIATPFVSSPDQWHSLSSILHSVKRHSAREINQIRGRTGALWQSETFDRIIRDGAEYGEKANYILQNAVKAGLVDDGWEYDGLWYDANES
jgi:putative transposase